MKADFILCAKIANFSQNYVFSHEKYTKYDENDLFFQFRLLRIAGN